MKLCNWNIEWMNRWFLPDRVAAAWKSASDKALGDRVAKVIQSIDPDVVTIQEGPSRLVEMELFVDNCLANKYDIIGPSGKGQQKLYMLVKKKGLVKSFSVANPNNEIDLGEPWAVDIDGDMILGEYKFTRQPQVVDVVLSDEREVQIINVHLKSKYVHNGRQLWNDPAQKHHFIRQALMARRRISAEAMRLREYLNEVLNEDENKAIIVCGDFNDGPGTDYFERLYLTHNLVAVISGNPFHPQVMMRHGFIDIVNASDNYTAIFNDFIDNEPDRKVLLDHILVSPGLFSTLTDGRVEHKAYKSQIVPAMSGREKYPSDHRPQSIKI